MICNQCKTAVSDDSAFCPVCGMTFQVQKCNNCGAMMNGGARFCQRCGKEQIRQNYCRFCNSPMYPGAAVCPTCGSATVQAASPVESGYAAKTLTFGILGLAFSATFIFSFLGIVFSAIARNFLSNYLGCTGGMYKDGRAKAGNGLSRAGLTVGIVFTSILVFSLLASL